MRNPEYITARDPANGKWYVCGKVSGRRDRKALYMPVSRGYETRVEAAEHCALQPVIDRDARRYVAGV